MKATNGGRNQICIIVTANIKQFVSADIAK